MMTFVNEKTKLIISGILIVVFIGLITLFALVDIDLGIIKISSVKTLLKQRREISGATAELKQQQSEYSTAVNNVKTEENKYKAEKAKYDAISDDTVNIIKEATTKESYNIEYMWIRLGNYAKSNNLSILMVEPGGAKAKEENKTDGKTADGKTADGKTDSTAATTNTTGTTAGTSTTAGTTNTTGNNADTSGATGATNTAGSTTPGATGSTNTSGTTTPGAAGATNTSGTTTPGSPGATGVTNAPENINKPNTDKSNADTVFKIQVSGSYIDVSDFIFEVENDKDLRFKLDNISIEYVSGNKIKANFDVKNLSIKK